MRERVIEIQADERLVVTVAQSSIEAGQSTPENEAVQTTPAPHNSGGENNTSEAENSGGENGKPMYIVGMEGDQHFDIEDSHNSEYMEDQRNALRYFENAGAAFVASTGDLCQYKDKDLIAFKEAYNSALPFFTCMGNHDYLRIYEQKDAAHQVPSGYKDFEDLWDKTVQSLAKGADVHYFGTSFKDRLNFWFEKDGDIWLFTSVDYGASTERYDVIRAINRLDYNDANVQLMTQYVSDTQYDRSREKDYDYRFYSPAVLIWVKNLFEANPKKRKFWQAHHFLPGKAGDTFDVYKHLRMWPVPASAEIMDKSYSGCNTVSGLTYWFFEKLLREHQNVILSGGHSHYATGEQEDVIRRAYRMTLPTGREVTPLVENVQSLDGTAYDYQVYRTEGSSWADAAPTVHIPSLAKPDKRYGQTLFGASEGVLMEAYDNKVVLKYIRFKAEGSTQYKNEIVKNVELPISNDSSAVVEPTKPEPSPEPEPTQDGITFRIHNSLSQTVRFSGKLQLYTTGADFPAFLNAPDDTSDGWPHWTKNSHSLAPGAMTTLVLGDLLPDYVGNGTTVITVYKPLSDYIGKKFKDADEGTFDVSLAIPAVKLGVYIFDSEKKSYSNSAFMLHVKPVGETIERGMIYDLYIDQLKSNASFDKDSGKKYIIV